LIASLKADLAQHSVLAKDAKSVKSKAENQKLEMAALQVQVAELKASLSDAQAQTKSLMLENKTLTADQKAVIAEKQSLAAENKTLSSKLAANRSAAASVESVNTKVPGSAVKTNGGIRMVGTVEAAQLAQAAQLKEDIYSDLTGLIIQGVKREAEEDVFNCLQTGRNGSKCSHGKSIMSMANQVKLCISNLPLRTKKQPKATRMHNALMCLY
jgi:hypothetical protein